MIKNGLAYWYVNAGADSRHLDMAIVSAGLLRQVIPDAIISLACDEECARSAVDSGRDLGRHFDEVRQFETEYTTSFLRSRAIKIGLRLQLEGDFVYLDSDTVIVEAFDDLIPPECHVGMALDMVGGIPGTIPRTLPENLTKIGWDGSVDRLFNCGVIYWKDDAEARKLAAQWLEAWEYSCSHGVVLDQPAMAFCDRELPGIISVLPPAVNVSPWVADRSLTRSARVWHMWPFSGHSGTILHAAISEFQRSGEINSRLLNHARKRRCPWVREGNMGVRHLAQRGRWGYALMEMPAAAGRLIAKLLFRKMRER